MSRCLSVHGERFLLDAIATDLLGRRRQVSCGTLNAADVTREQALAHLLLAIEHRVPGGRRGSGERHEHGEQCESSFHCRKSS